jgi:anhydro-N-acetylmuramic acid kinase
VQTCFIGLMSGTSLDGVDGVAVEFEGDYTERSLRVRAHAHVGFGAPLQAELLALNRSGADELHRAALAGNALARSYATVVELLLHESRLPRERVVAIGCHGQTVRHRPSEFDGTGYTLQINAPALIAELCGIDVVADFRSRDVAAGGQGAPLAPAFHRAMFGRAKEPVAVLNLGGIANISCLAGPEDDAIGFDCGPGNALLDLWCAAKTGRPFDRDGAWAATGRVDDRLLRLLLTEPFFAQPPPKSTGRDLFHLQWLEAQLSAAACANRISDADVQATLAELTAQTSAAAFRSHGCGARELVVCGGGAFNGDLMARLARLVAPASVVASSARGLPPDQVEAVGFAWLARAFTERWPGNIPAVTGAMGPRVLGALYPAGKSAAPGA